MTDSQIDALLEIFQARMQKVADEYFKRMGQQVREIGEIIPSDQTRLVQLKKLGSNIAYIQREIAYAAEASIEDVARIFEAIAAEDETLGGFHVEQRFVKRFKVVVFNENRAAFAAVETTFLLVKLGNLGID